MSERRRPTHTVLIPVAYLLPGVAALIEAGCTFTCEPSPRNPAVWMVGVLADGVKVINSKFGPTADVGTLGEWGVLDGGEDG